MRSPGFVCCDDFRIVGFDGAGEYDGMFAFDVFCALPEFDCNADSLQTIGFWRWVHDLNRPLQRPVRAAFQRARSCPRLPPNADEMGCPQIIHAFLRTERRMGWIKNDGTGFTLVVRHDCSSCMFFLACSIMVSPMVSHMADHGWDFGMRRTHLPSPQPTFRQSWKARAWP